jgi:hypothetical protein
MRSIAACSFLLVAVVCAPARAQDAALDDARLSTVRAAIAADVEAARSEGLPADWLLDKVAEGLSKRVPPARIAAAVHALLERIRVGDRLLASIARPARPLRQAVDALTAGVPQAELARLVRAVIDREDVVSVRASAVRAALVTVAELAEREFGGEAAARATLDAYRRGGQSGLRTLLRDARRLEPASSSRDDALRRLGQGVDRGGRGRDHGLDGEPGRGHR